MKSLTKAIHQDWFKHLSKKQQDLIELSIFLYERETRPNSSRLVDYGFIVFPMSKAYEGFLKKYLLDHNLITKRVYDGRRFRIGRALNPDIRKKYRDDLWLYDEVSQVCGQKLSRKMWNTWLECRNRVFHYFPREFHFLNLEEAASKLKMVVSTMQEMVECGY